jgi:hypothetical protein
LKDIKDFVFVSIVPTLAPEKVGYRYFFFKNLHDYLESSKIKNFIVAPANLKEVSKIYDNNVLYVDGLAYEDGFDLGKNSPKDLHSVIRKVMEDIQSIYPSSPILIHAYECSLSLMYALFNLERSYLIFINWQDPSFWFKFLTMRTTKPARSIIRKYIEISPNVRLFVESKQFAEKCFKVLSAEFIQHPTPSAIPPSRLSRLEPADRAIVMEGNWRLMIRGAEELLRKSSMSVWIFIRQEENSRIVKEWLVKQEANLQRRVNLVDYYPDFEQYLNIYDGARLIVVLYEDNRRASSASGILLDSLILAHQIVVVEGNALAIAGERWGKERITTYKKSDPDSLTESINRAIQKSNICLSRGAHTHTEKTKPNFEWLVETFNYLLYQTKKQEKKKHLMLHKLTNTIWLSLKWGTVIRNKSRLCLSNLLYLWKNLKHLLAKIPH